MLSTRPSRDRPRGFELADENNFREQSFVKKLLPNCTKYFGGHCGLIIQSSLIFLYGLLKVLKLRSLQASIKTVCLVPSTNNTCRARDIACLETGLIYYLH